MAGNIDFSKGIVVDPKRIGFRLAEVVVGGKKYKISANLDGLRRLSGLNSSSEEDVFRSLEEYIAECVTTASGSEGDLIVIDP